MPRTPMSAHSLPATNSALTFADAMAVRPGATALEVIRKGAERIVEVTDDEIAEAIRSTHNCAEGLGAAALAAVMKDRAKLQGQRAAVILTGQNIDRAWMQAVLAGGTPRVSEANSSRA
jgi:threonine dehydratase